MSAICPLSDQKQTHRYVRFTPESGHRELASICLLCAKNGLPHRSNGKRRNYYLIEAAGIGLASVAAKPQAATNRRWLAQDALRRA